jgi:UDP:flavonoid glycosyltransferase YjiC (YdhE family)
MLARRRRSDLAQMTDLVCATIDAVGPERRSVLVVTWGSGGNLPPLLAAAELLAARGFSVEMLTSAATRAAARDRGFGMHAYRRTPDPDVTVPFEAQAGRMLAMAAGIELATDVLELARELPIDLVVADCMLPGALAAGEATGVPTVSLVHFAYALARSVMARGGGAWTTDRVTLNDTRRQLGLAATSSGIGAWESPRLLLVTVPRWFDAPGELPPHVLHAGPLGVRTVPATGRAADEGRALLAFSTTVMDGQSQLVENACAAIGRTDREGVLTLGGVLEPPAAGKLAGVSVIDWADHDALIARCDVVVTHGGLGTTLRALAHGRPLLVLPLGRDQHFNAERVVAVGAGLQLPATADPEEIAEALERLFAEPAFHDAACRAAAAIAAERPEKTAADALDRVAVA